MMLTAPVASEGKALVIPLTSVVTIWPAVDRIAGKLATRFCAKLCTA